MALSHLLLVVRLNHSSSSLRMTYTPGFQWPKTVAPCRIQDHPVVKFQLYATKWSLRSKVALVNPPATLRTILVVKDTNLDLWVASTHGSSKVLSTILIFANLLALNEVRSIHVTILLHVLNCLTLVDTSVAVYLKIILQSTQPAIGVIIISVDFFWVWVCVLSHLGQAKDKYRNSYTILECSRKHKRSHLW